MEKIKITIPDNLTPEQELMAIAKQLGRKLLPLELDMRLSTLKLKLPLKESKLKSQ